MFFDGVRKNAMLEVVPADASPANMVATRSAIETVANFTALTLAAERDDQLAVGSAALRLRRQVPQGAGVLAGEVGDEHDSAVRLHEVGHLDNVAGIVDPPRRPLRKRERLARVSGIELLGVGPVRPVADVVDVIADDVDV